MELSDGAPDNIGASRFFTVSGSPDFNTLATVGRCLVGVLRQVSAYNRWKLETDVLQRYLSCESFCIISIYAVSCCRFTEVRPTSADLCAVCGALSGITCSVGGHIYQVIANNSFTTKK